MSFFLPKMLLLNSESNEKYTTIISSSRINDKARSTLYGMSVLLA